MDVFRLTVNQVKVKCQPLQYLNIGPTTYGSYQRNIKRILLYVLIYVVSKQFTHIGPVDIHKPMDSPAVSILTHVILISTETDELCRLLMKDVLRIRVSIYAKSFAGNL